MLKRAVDFTAAAMMLVMLAPVFVIVATLVACDVGMPVVFWQQRPGLYGRRFKVYKFRTMRNSHNLAGQRIPDEKRLSAIGRFLRRSRLDELPQLYNVLMGEMSFVGPRPLLAAEQGHLDWSRLVVRPGLTGWAQVNGGRNIAVEEKAALDRWYVKKMSPLLDASILLRTIGMLVRGDIPNQKSLKIAMEAMSASTDRSDVGQVSSGRVFENQTGSNR
jgi:lipopolysaccharide/colanic/teichoic acid biosynthesis glycosyltransferase